MYPNKQEGRAVWSEYFLQIAQDVAARGTCIRRNYGAVIVKDNIIVSTGYTGAPRGEKNCCTLGVCERERLNIPSGQRYELCRSVHAEMNAIINADPAKMIEATIYIVGIDYKTGEVIPAARPCDLCRRMIVNARIVNGMSWDKDKKVAAIDF